MSTSQGIYCSFNWRSKVGFLTVFLTNNIHLCNCDAVKVCNMRNGSVEESLHCVNFFAVATNLANCVFLTVFGSTVGISV